MDIQRISIENISYHSFTEADTSLHFTYFTNLFNRQLSKKFQVLRIVGVRDSSQVFTFALLLRLYSFAYPIVRAVRERAAANWCAAGRILQTAPANPALIRRRLVWFLSKAAR